MLRLAFLALSGLALLTGCGSVEEDAPTPPPADAAIDDALAMPIMTDPDLSAQSGVDAAIVVPGPASAALPPIDRGDAAIDAAKAAAARLVGGAPPAVPAPTRKDLTAFRDAMTAAQLAATAKVARPDCVRQASSTARWGAALPEVLQPYPRGALVEAAGTDAAGCALRAVRYRTPVLPDDVLAFHYARLRAAGYAVRHGADGDDHLLAGRKGAMGYAVHVGKPVDGLTPVDVVTGG